MVQRFLFDGVNGQRTGPAIHLADQSSAVIPTALADAGLAIGYTAVMRTELTAYCPTLQFLIILTLHHQ